MKKCLVFLMALTIAFLPCGCGKQPPSKPAASKITATSSVASSTVSSAQNVPVNTAAWPTKDWSISTPEQQGIDAAKLAKADKRIQDNYPNFYSLLIVRHGYLVYEKYYSGMTRDNANPVYSVTKSVTSALTGIAVQKKLLQGVNQRISDLLPEYFTKVDNQQKRDITVEHALTMTGGLRSTDDDFGSFYRSSDWAQDTLSQPLTAKPGTKFGYNTGLPQFLSVIIAKNSGMSLRKFAEENLFSKIGVTVHAWDKDSKGYYGGGFGLSLTPRDMAKFGYLYLHNGNWNGEQIIPQDWIKASIGKHVAVDKGLDYGYLFWIQQVCNSENGKSWFAYHAAGSGGQIIIMVPDLDLVAVITADVRSKSKDGKDTLSLIPGYVIPAVNQ